MHWCRPAHLWFLKIAFPGTSCVCVCVCVFAAMLLITSNMMWCDMDPYDWLNKFYNVYMAEIVRILLANMPL